MIGNQEKGEGQVTPRKSCTPFLEILLFYLAILGNPFVLSKISYAICKSELHLGKRLARKTVFGFWVIQEKPTQLLWKEKKEETCSTVAIHCFFLSMIRSHLRLYLNFPPQTIAMHCHQATEKLF